MTRLEMICKKEVEETGNYYISSIIENIPLEDLIQADGCPYDFNNNFSDGYYSDTEIVDSEGETIGCQGITCKECWNKQAEESE